MSALYDYIDPIDIDRPVTVEHPLVHASGVYFGMSEEEYHGALALSASGIKWLRVSTLDWWARSPLNLDREEEEDTEAKTIGKAYHKRIIEGREAFDAAYAATIDPTEYPDAIRTIEDLKQGIADCGGPTKGLSGLRKDALIERLLDLDPSAQIWDRLVADHASSCGEREQLPAKLMHKIEIAAAMIERHPDLSKAFTGGRPEVSIFWRDEQTGTPMKARLDYLKSRAIVDLKSFDHQGRPIDKAIARSVAAYKYHIQVRFYLDAVTQAKRLIRAGHVYGETDADYLSSIAASESHTFMFVWQAKGVAPLARGKVMPPGLTLSNARDEIDYAKHVWARCWEAFGPDDPWLDTAGISTFDDTDFPAFINE